MPDIDYNFPHGAGLAEVRETLNTLNDLPTDTVDPYAPIRVEMPEGNEWGGRFKVTRIYVYENKRWDQTIRIVVNEDENA